MTLKPLKMVSLIFGCHFHIGGNPVNAESLEFFLDEYMSETVKPCLITIRDLLICYSVLL